MAPCLHTLPTLHRAQRALVLSSALSLSCTLCACTTTQSPPPPPPPPPPAQPTPPPAQAVPTTVAPTSQDTVPPASATPTQHPPAPTPPTDDVRLEVLPGIWVNRAQRTVDFEGTVAIDAHNPKTPIVYLEWIVCAPDTKEHESLVLTNIKPSHLHAALLLLDYQPGAPGEWKWEGTTISSIPPRGQSLQVFVQPLSASRVPDTTQPPVPITDWIVGKPKAQEQPQTLSEHWPQDTFVFAGSIMISPRPGRAESQDPALYKADQEGGHIGLTTFGHEVIVWSRMFNPDSGVEAPYWIANSKKVPPYTTPVRIIISPHPAAANP